MAMSLVKGFQYGITGSTRRTVSGCERRHGSECVPCRGAVVVNGGLMKHPYFLSFIRPEPEQDHRHTCGRWRYDSDMATQICGSDNEEWTFERVYSDPRPTGGVGGKRPKVDIKVGAVAHL